MLAGLLVPTEGEVLVEGQPVVAGTGSVGISFQHARLQLIRPTVLSDVAYGADEDRATAALRSVGLDPVTMGPRRVDELSGGEQRRVALAGLLVRDPVLLVLDEPYAGLDDEARAGLATILARLRDEREMATVVVSHDLDNAELLGGRLVTLAAGRVVAERSALERSLTTAGPRRGGGTLEAAGVDSRKRARNLQLNEIHVVRFVPGTSPLHRMWAGTKLVALGALSIALLLWPSWRSIGIVGMLVLIAFLAARLPRGISPRLPWWLGGIVLAGAVIALVSGGKPEVHLGSLKLGLGGLGNFARFFMVGVDVLAARPCSVGRRPWPTCRPLWAGCSARCVIFGCPWTSSSGAIALSIRCLPLLLEEARVLRAARRARRPPTPRSFKELGDESVEVVFGALANAIRRAREIAEAIEARGGVPTVAPETHALARIDAFAFVVGAVAVSAMAVLR